MRSTCCRRSSSGSERASVSCRSVYIKYICVFIAHIEPNFRTFDINLHSSFVQDLYSFMCDSCRLNNENHGQVYPAGVVPGDSPYMFTVLNQRKDMMNESSTMSFDVTRRSVSDETFREFYCSGEHCRVVVILWCCVVVVGWWESVL